MFIPDILVALAFLLMLRLIQIENAITSPKITSFTKFRQIILYERRQISAIRRIILSRNG